MRTEGDLQKAAQALSTKEKATPATANASAGRPHTAPRTPPNAIPPAPLLPQLPSEPTSVYTAANMVAAQPSTVNGSAQSQEQLLKAVQRRAPRLVA